MPSYLGIDIGSRGVKVVQLENDRGRARLVTYGYEVSAPGAVMADVTKREPAATAAALKAVLSRARVSTKKAIAALPSFSVFSSMLTLPTVSQKELPEAIRWEAKKVIPLPIEEMILDSKIVEGWGAPAAHGGASASAGGAGIIETGETPTTHVFLTAAPKKLVEQYLQAFKEAQIELLSLETEILALVRALLWNETAPAMLVDIGASTTTIAIITDQIPVLARSIEFGGSALTHALATRMRVTDEEAERVKHALSVSNYFSLDPIAADAAPLLNELRYAVQLYDRSDLAALAGSRRIEKIVLTGGGALFPGLAAHITAQLNLNTILGDPWARIAYPVELRPVLDTLVGTFAIPIGLALRDIEVTKK